MPGRWLIDNRGVLALSEGLDDRNKIDKGSEVPKFHISALNRPATSIYLCCSTVISIHSNSCEFSVNASCKIRKIYSS